ncbi:hypothetical protein B484DRAFT_426066 [Ochromonadaceae sp. CCMP2298]|nr:hypothetical protein B484DRAFT_426066 [Ochromonadaceae sp. CCMP2298]
MLVVRSRAKFLASSSSSSAFDEDVMMFDNIQKIIPPSPSPFPSPQMRGGRGASARSCAGAAAHHSAVGL